MDTKTKIVELIKELSEAATLAAQLNMNIVYLESHGNNIPDDLPLERLFLQAQGIRSEIDQLNYEVISNAEEY